MTGEQRARLEGICSNTVSDAMTALKIRNSGSTYGIRPIWEGCPRICGEAITAKIGPEGFAESASTHFGVLQAMQQAKPGSVLVMDHGGRMDVSSFGGIMATTAQINGMAGVVVDGITRDIDCFAEIGFPVYSRGAAVATSRGKTMAYSINRMIQFGGIQVRPGDIVVADRSGVVIIPQERFEEVLELAEELNRQEEEMIKTMRTGADPVEVDQKFNYEQMLNEKGKEYLEGRETH